MSALRIYARGSPSRLKIWTDDSVHTVLRENSMASIQRLTVQACRGMTTRTSATVEKDKDRFLAIRPFSEVPGPRGLPLVGTLFEYIKKDGPTFSKIFEVQLLRHREYGEIFKERIGLREFVMIGNPWEYSKVIRAEGKYPMRTSLDALAMYRRSRGRPVGMTNAQGEEWYNQRSAVSKKVLKPFEIAKFADTMAEVADDFTSLLESERDGVGELPDLKLLLFRWTMESVGTFIFEERLGCLGTKPSPTAQAFIDSVLGSLRSIHNLFFGLPIYRIYPTKEYRKLAANQDKIYEFGRLLVQKKLSEVKSGTAKSGFFEFLLEKENSDVEQITNVSIELLSGATDTVTTLTSWCLYTLATNPQSQEKMYEEIREAKVKVGGHLTGQDIIKLPYVKAVLKETLRKIPVAYCTSRFLPDDLELGGYHIPARTEVSGNTYAMNHNPDYFTNPEEFHPERWLHSDMSQTVKSLSQLAWGHGPRMCIGRRIAEQEIHIVLTKIVEKFEISYHHEEIKPVLALLLVPDKPVHIRLRPRQHQL